MKKAGKIIVAAVICTLCLTGCGVKKDWTEDEGELVRADSDRQVFFVLDREVAD